MEYYLLRQAGNIVNPIKITNLDPLVYKSGMSHQNFKNLDEAVVGYVSYEPEKEIPDILTYPAYMVSDVIRKVMSMYDENISFKAVQVFPDNQEYIKEASKVYWIYDCVMENCIHPDTVILPNGAIKQVILDKHKVKGRDIFRIKNTVENKTIISLAVAESIMRRNLYGVGLERVIMR